MNEATTTKRLSLETPLDEIERRIASVDPEHPRKNRLARRWKAIERNHGKTVQRCFDEWARAMARGSFNL